MMGNPRGSRYIAYNAVDASMKPVNFSNHVWKYAAVMRSIHQLTAATPIASFAPTPSS